MYINTYLALCLQAVQFKFWGNHLCHVFSISSSTSTTTAVGRKRRSKQVNYYIREKRTTIPKPPSISTDSIKLFSCILPLASAFSVSFYSRIGCPLCALLDGRSNVVDLGAIFVCNNGPLCHKRKKGVMFKLSILLKGAECRGKITRWMCVRVNGKSAEKEINTENNEKDVARIYRRGPRIGSKYHAILGRSKNDFLFFSDIIKASSSASPITIFLPWIQCLQLLCPSCASWAFSIPSVRASHFWRGFFFLLLSVWVNAWSR